MKKQNYLEKKGNRKKADLKNVETVQEKRFRDSQMKKKKDRKRDV